MNTLLKSQETCHAQIWRIVIVYPVYYINMNGHKYRRASVEKQIKDYNIANAYRVVGVDVYAIRLKRCKSSGGILTKTL